MRLSDLLAVTALLEGATGLLLIAAPGIVSWLLFGMDLEASGAIMGRLAGIALASLSCACWVGRHGPNQRVAFAGMPAFNVLSTVYLAIIGFSGQSGLLLWPMVVLHLVVSILLMRARDR